MFLYNSFIGELLEAALERVRDSLVRAPRRLTLVYVHPVTQPDWLEQAPWLRRRCELSTGFWDHNRTVVYEADEATVMENDGGGAAAAPLAGRNGGVR